MWIFQWPTCELCCISCWFSPDWIDWSRGNSNLFTTDHCTQTETFGEEEGASALPIGCFARQSILIHLGKEEVTNMMWYITAVIQSRTTRLVHILTRQPIIVTTKDKIRQTKKTRMQSSTGWLRNPETRTLGEIYRSCIKSFVFLLQLTSKSLVREAWTLLRCDRASRRKSLRKLTNRLQNYNKLDLGENTPNHQNTSKLNVANELDPIPVCFRFNRKATLSGEDVC